MNLLTKYYVELVRDKGPVKIKHELFDEVEGFEKIKRPQGGVHEISQEEILNRLESPLLKNILKSHPNPSEDITNMIIKNWANKKLSPSLKIQKAARSMQKALNSIIWEIILERSSIKKPEETQENLPVINGLPCFLRMCPPFF